MRAADEMTLREAARRFGLSLKQVQRRADRQTLRTRREGNVRLVRMADLVAAGLLDADAVEGDEGRDEVDAKMQRVERLAVALNEAVTELRAELAVERGSRGG